MVYALIFHTPIKKYLLIFLDVLFWFDLIFLSVYRMSDSYIYDECSCLDKPIRGESATMHLLFAEYRKIKFYLDALDVSFSAFV